MDTAEQLRFIIDFANEDLGPLREGDWLNLQDDFSRFFPETEPHVPWKPIYWPLDEGPFPKEKFPALQDELRLLLRVRAAEAFSDATIPPIHIEFDCVLISGGALTFQGEDRRSLFLLRVIHLLTDPGTVESIRRCPNCGKFFFKVRRQKFCSRPCTLKTNKRDWLDEQRRLKAEHQKGKGLSRGKQRRAQRKGGK